MECTCNKITEHAQLYHVLCEAILENSLFPFVSFACHKTDFYQPYMGGCHVKAMLSYFLTLTLSFKVYEVRLLYYDTSVWLSDIPYHIPQTLFISMACINYFCAKLMVHVSDLFSSNGLNSIHC